VPDRRTLLGGLLGTLAWGCGKPTPEPAPTANAMNLSGTVPPSLKSGVSLTLSNAAPDNLPGKLAGEVFVTPESHFAYYAKLGFDHVRLQGSWERLQPSLYGSLGELPLDHFDDAGNPLRNAVQLTQHYIDRANANGLKVLLDLCHNYGRRYVGYAAGSWNNKRKVEIGTDDCPIGAWADFCVKSVQQFGEGVAGIELMNEPHDLQIGARGWRDACQIAIDAIRRVNSSIPIYIDGYQWSSAEAWRSVNPTLHTLDDPYLFWTAHTYFDRASEGFYGGREADGPLTSNDNIGLQRLRPFEEWLMAHGFQGRGHIGEYGIPNSEAWRETARRFIVRAQASGIGLCLHQDVPYPNDPYIMNTFPGEGETDQIPTLLQSLIMAASPTR
jgi:hypothetical protein